MAFQVTNFLQCSVQSSRTKQFNTANVYVTMALNPQVEWWKRPYKKHKFVLKSTK